MSILLKQRRVVCVAVLAFLLGACSSVVTPPVEQIHQIHKTKTPVKMVEKKVEGTHKVNIYRCDNGKRVEVDRQKKDRKLDKKESVKITFQGTSHLLSSTVTRNGRKYTNIRWTWNELRNGKAFLYDNTKRNLAVNCVKQ
ncbi:MliC family protein [Mannheimia pernigra]|uniref:MliC family protein n=1 Tax=Mannheimia pernigra TaxID=111844 RepID=UPI00131997DA|nr:MliC family protein [Mannheimia pernigra]QHB17185.1 opacity-associated protein B [Mannheimia pernigra]